MKNMQTVMKVIMPIKKLKKKKKKKKNINFENNHKYSIITFK